MNKIKKYGEKKIIYFAAKLSLNGKKKENLVLIEYRVSNAIPK